MDTRHDLLLSVLLHGLSPQSTVLAGRPRLASRFPNPPASMSIYIPLLCIHRTYPCTLVPRYDTMY